MIGRILFITIDQPRDDGSGGQIASWRLLQSYASLAPVDLVAITPPGGTTSADPCSLAANTTLVPVSAFYFASSPIRLGIKFAISQVGKRPYRLTKFDVSHARDVIRSQVQRHDYDLVHFDHLSSFVYHKLIKGAPSILMEHNVESDLIGRMASEDSRRVARVALRREARRVEAIEARIVHDVDHVLTLSEHDRVALSRLSASNEEQVSVWPVPIKPTVIERPSERAVFNVLVLGSLKSAGRWHGLTWFLDNVWPRVCAQVDHARLSVVGACSVKQRNELAGKDSVKVYGYIDDIDSLLREVSLCAIPLFVGAGIRIKVLELLSRGIPCIGSEVALQGLPDIRGTDLVHTADEWVSSLTAAARSPETLSLAARDGLAELQRTHSPAAALTSLTQAVEAAVRRNETRRQA
ncbi:MAG: glycosyltransferase [Phenylobacterium sp.]|nr:MAG: glycosyltransferase [Phenylobacterium sp.]